MTKIQKQLLMGYNSSSDFVLAVENGKVVFSNNATGGRFVGDSIMLVFGEETAEIVCSCISSGESFSGTGIRFLEHECRLDIYPGSSISVLIFSPTDGNKPSLFPPPSISLLSSEMRNYLSNIMASLKFMPPKSSMSPKSARYFSAIEQSCFELSRINNNISDYVRFFDPAFTPSLKLENMCQTCKFCVDESRPILAELGIPIYERIPESISESILFCYDEQLIERVIFNLLSNSAKYTRPGNYIELSVHSVEKNCILNISDHGSGFDSSRLASAFSQFTSEDIPAPGTNYGIGLALCRRIIELHNGRMLIESKVGEGTTVSISLPIVKPLHTNLGSPDTVFRDYANGFPRALLEFSTALEPDTFGKLLDRARNRR